MEGQNELIKFGSTIPIKCFVHRLGYSSKHWHNSIELLFILSGEVEISVNNITYTLKSDDVIVINSNEIHELKSNDCTLIATQIDLSIYDKDLIDINNMYFNCNSSYYENKAFFNNLKKIVAQLVKINSIPQEYNEIITKSLCYSLLHELIINFKSEKDSSDSIQTKKYFDRLSRILTYINNNFKQDISLSDIAVIEHLSIPYLSKFFTKNMNINFLTYLNTLRLNSAVKDLFSTDNSVETIAYNNGFPNAKAFVQIFKKEYKTLPSQYRKDFPKKSLNSNSSISTHSFVGYLNLDLNHHGHLAKLANYLNDDINFIDTNKVITKDYIVHKDIDISTVTTELKNTFKVFTSVGSAKEILLEDIQNMLRTIQKEIGYEYIKFHGILSDDMHVYKISKDGTPSISFTLVFKAIDFLLSIGLKPLIQLSFMPKDLAVYPNNTAFDSNFIISEPNDMNKWNYLIKSFITSLINHYGTLEVESWLFTIWNEPDTPNNMFGLKSDELFYDLYKNTFDTIKNINPHIQIGSPSSYYIAILDDVWIHKFIKWSKKNNCLPDFINIHFYDTNFISNSFSELNSNEVGKSTLTLSEDTSSFSKFITQLSTYVENELDKNHKIYLTEWNSSPSHFDLLSDTCFKSCYLTKNLLENFDKLASFGYWVLSDFFQEYQIPENLFHGGLGLFTYNGIKKPSYYAFYLINKLGSEFIEKGDGYFITKENNEIRIMLYNYKHFSSLYAQGEMFDMTLTDRYTVFGQEKKKEFNLKLKNINYNNFIVTEYIVNRQYGSAFDKWVEMGAMPFSSQEEIDYLSSLSKPMINKYKISSYNNSLNINAILEQLEIRLIIIKPNEN